MEGGLSGRWRARLRWSNTAASVAAIALACAAFAAIPVHRAMLLREHAIGGIEFTGSQFLWLAALAYALAVTAFMFGAAKPRPCGPLRCVALVARWLTQRDRYRRAPLPRAHKVAALSTLLKAFFGPLMVMSLMGFCAAAWRIAHAMLAEQVGPLDPTEWFVRYGYWFALQAILFVDVALFTVGYLLESRRLGNEIRSVDATWLGWAAALACYPPFNAVSAALLGSQHEDYPQFANATIHVVAFAAILVLMTVYSAASVALGLKASNLTHRGIVSRGPYAWVRHPAYASKNIAWWIGSVPLVALAFQAGWLDGLMAIGSVLGWTALYVLRALTEEDHLRSVDANYAAYAATVRFRFIPGIV